MKFRDFFTSNRNWKEQPNGSWWNQATSEYITALTFKMLEDLYEDGLKESVAFTN